MFTTKLVELEPGQMQVTGRIAAVESPLRGPISGRPCVFYQVIGTNHTWPWHEQSSPSLGPMETAGALHCSIAGEVIRRTIYAGESPELDRLLEPGHGRSRSDDYLNAEERIVAAGDALTVIGEAMEEIDPQVHAAHFRSLPTRLFLRARSLCSVTPGR